MFLRSKIYMVITLAIEPLKVNKLTSLFYASVLLLIVKFRHHIAKVAVKPSGSADYFDNVMTKFIVNNRTDALKTDINLLFTITDCQIPRFRSPTRSTNFKFTCLSAY